MSDGDWRTDGEGLSVPFGAGDATAHVIIGSPASGLIPADLIAYYAGFTETVTAAIVQFAGGTQQYEYQAWIVDNTGLAYTTSGGKDGAGIIGEVSRYWNATGVAINAWGFHNPNTIMRVANTTFLVFETGAKLMMDPGCDFQIDGVSCPRGLKAYVGSTAGTGAIGAEAVVLTSPAMTFVDGRCYEVEWSHNVIGNTAAPGSFSFVRFRQTNLAGALKATGQVHLPAAGAQNLGFGRFRIRRATGAGDLVDNLVMTLQATVGTVTQTGAAADVRNFTIRDCGAETDYPSAITI